MLTAFSLKRVTEVLTVPELKPQGRLLRDVVEIDIETSMTARKWGW